MVSMLDDLGASAWPPERSAAPLRPVGCMRGLGSTACGARSALRHRPSWQHRAHRHGKPAAAVWRSRSTLDAESVKEGRHIAAGRDSDVRLD